MAAGISRTGIAQQGFESLGNRIEVAFDPALPTKGRYMACSGGCTFRREPHLRALQPRTSKKQTRTITLVHPLNPTKTGINHGGPMVSTPRRVTAR